MTMRIVVLDGYTLNPGDLDWGPLRQLGEVQIHDRSTPSEVIERAAGANAVLTNKAVLSEQALLVLPELAYIGVTATGVNVVDVPCARRQGICVTNVPGYSTESVAQHVFALLLALTSRVFPRAEQVRDGQWAEAPDWCFWTDPPIELAGLTMGIVGFGQIGRATARRARAFGMQVVVHTRTPAPSGNEPPAVRFVERDELLSCSDVISLHCPLNEDTQGMIDERALALIKPTAYLINTARGPLVDELALSAALNEGRLAGAGLDVLIQEPPPPDHPLTTARNCLITPHVAWASLASRQRLLQVVCDNLEAFQEGCPKNVVS